MADCTDTRCRLCTANDQDAQSSISPSVFGSDVARLSFRLGPVPVSTGRAASASMLLPSWALREGRPFDGR